MMYSTTMCKSKFYRVPGKIKLLQLNTENWFSSHFSDEIGRLKYNSNNEKHQSGELSLYKTLPSQ